MVLHRYLVEHVAAIIIGLFVIILSAFGLIRIKDIASLSPHQIDASAVRASMSNAQTEQAFTEWAPVRRSVA